MHSVQSESNHLFFAKPHQHPFDVGSLCVRVLELFLNLQKLFWRNLVLEGPEMCFHSLQVARKVQLLLARVVVELAWSWVRQAAVIRKRVALDVGKHHGLLGVKLDKVVFIHLLHDSPDIARQFGVIDLRQFLQLELLKNEPLFFADDVIGWLRAWLLAGI